MIEIDFENMDGYEVIVMVITGVLLILASLPYRFGIIPTGTRNKVYLWLTGALLITLAEWLIRVVVLKQSV